jgi:hypothetical protein
LLLLSDRYGSTGMGKVPSDQDIIFRVTLIA